MTLVNKDYYNYYDCYYDPYVPMTAKIPKPSNPTAMEHSTASYFELLDEPDQDRPWITRAACPRCILLQEIGGGMLGFRSPKQDSRYLHYIQDVDHSGVPLDTHHLRVCDRCLPLIQEEVAFRRYPPQTSASYASKEATRAKNVEKKKRAREEEADKLSNAIFWWKIRGLFWTITSLASIGFHICAICNFLPPFPHYLQPVIPVIPVFVFLSVLWSVWDPTYSTRYWALFERRKMRIVGKYEHIIFQMSLWVLRLLTSTISWLWWFSSRKGYSTYLDPSSSGGRIYFSIAIFLEVVAQFLSFYRLNCQQIESPPVNPDTHLPRSHPMFGHPKASVAPTDPSSLLDPAKCGDDYHEFEREQLFKGLSDYVRRRNVPPPPETLTGLEELLAKTTLEDKANEPEPEPSKSFWASFFGDILSKMLRICRAIFLDLGGIILLVLSVLGRIIYSILVYVGSVILFTPFILGNTILSLLVTFGKFLFATMLSYGVSMREMLAKHFNKWWRTYATVVVLTAVGHLVFRFWRFEFDIHYDEANTTFSISVSPVSAIVSSVKSRFGNAMSRNI